MSDKRGKAALFSDERFSEKEIDKLTVEEPPAVESAVAEALTPKVVFGATQGKKGHKAKRINMAFSDENHEWIKRRSRQLGISATELVNSILDHERAKEG